MDIFPALLRARAHRWIGWIAALIGPLAGIALRVLLGRTLMGFPFMSFFPGILLAAMLGGLWPGLAAMVLSALLAVYFLIPPFETFALTWPAGWLALITFVTVGTVLVLLVNEAAKTGQRLSTMNDELEARVAERTRELTLLAAQLREEIQIKEQAEMQVRQMQKMEAVGQLTGGIAHDFNNMLAIIMGSLEMLSQRRAAGCADVGKLLDNAMHGARRAATLTHQLLAFSRRQPLAPAVADISGIVSTMAELLRRTLGETISLDCRLASGMWRARVDTGQLENAILNLAVNARDAMPQGGKLTIETRNTELDEAYAAIAPDVAPGQYVMIALTDTGHGMPPEVIARAFEPFFTTKPAGHGTGLGLAQVYGFIKQSNGHVKIDSQQGAGTVVKIYLPRFDGPETTPALPAPSAPPTGSPAEIVLLVEDDEAVRLVHVSMLRGLNYTVLHAASGQEALDMLRTSPGVTLLFTDIVMPGMSGQTLAEMARRQIPALKILYTTGYTASAIEANADLLQKPFSYDTLAHKLRTVLDRN
jgi:signal transduction histidine kinase